MREELKKDIKAILLTIIFIAGIIAVALLSMVVIGNICDFVGPIIFSFENKLITVALLVVCFILIGFLGALYQVGSVGLNLSKYLRKAKNTKTKKALPTETTDK